MIPYHQAMAKIECDYCCDLHRKGKHCPNPRCQKIRKADEREIDWDNVEEEFGDDYIRDEEWDYDVEEDTDDDYDYDKGSFEEWVSTNEEKNDYGCGQCDRPVHDGVCEGCEWRCESCKTIYRKPIHYLGINFGYDHDAKKVCYARTCQVRINKVKAKRLLEKTERMLCRYQFDNLRVCPHIEVDKKESFLSVVITHVDKTSIIGKEKKDTVKALAKISKFLQHTKYARRWTVDTEDHNKKPCLTYSIIHKDAELQTIVDDTLPFIVNLFRGKKFPKRRQRK